MTIKLITAIAVATGVLAMSNTAEAGGKRHGFNDRDFVQSVKHKRHRKHGRFHRQFHFGDFYHGHRPYRTCRHLRRKAHYTGTRYWWKRYRHCVRRNFR